jgi:hypothetical protein
MKRPPTLSLHAARPLATLLLILVARGGVAFAGARPLPGAETKVARKDREGPKEALAILSTGDPAERREVAQTACRRFEVLQASSSGPATGAIVQELRRYLQREKDDWVSTLLLHEIGCLETPALHPLFLDALASPSPNLRWQAYRWFARFEAPDAVPLLERLWPDEKRVWARTSLMEALSRNRSVRYLEEFRGLAEGTDPELSSGALRDLKRLGDEIAIPLLARLAREGEIWQRRGAADALSLDPESEVALGALLDASRDTDPLTRECAVQSLARRKEKIAIGRVLAVALTDPDGEVRRAGIRSLEAHAEPSTIRRTLRAAAAPQGADRDAFEYRLLQYIGQADSSANPTPTVAPDSAGGDEEELRCSFRPRPGCGPEGSGSMRAFPAAGKSSARCFRFPGIPGDPHLYWRVARGDLLFIYDHFEAQDGPWVRVGGSETPQQCWMPSGQVVPAKMESPPREEEGILRRDFDLPAAEVASPAYAAMVRQGMIEVIDTGEGIPGVTIRVRMGSAEDAATLRYVATLPEEPLALDLIWMIEKGSTRVCGYPSMVTLAADLGVPVAACPAGAERWEEGPAQTSGAP